MSKILLIGVSVRALAESAVKSGYPVIALDAFGDSDLENLCEVYSLSRDFQIPYSARGLFLASQELKFDGFSYTSNLENHPAVVQDFSRSALTLGNPPEVLRRARHWPGFYSFLSQNGYLVPVTLFSDDFPIDGKDRQWLIKPVRSGGGQHISFWKPGRKIRPGFMLQEYIPGKSCSASFISNGIEAVVIGITEQIIGVPIPDGRNFFYRGNILPLDNMANPVQANRILAQVQQAAALLTREFRLVGMNGIDFILAGENIYITELNPRYCASMELIERAYNIPVFDLHYRAVTRGELQAFRLEDTGTATGRYIAKSILYADRDCCAPDTRGWFARGIRDIPHSGETLRKNKPVCTIFAEGNSRDECLSNLTKATKNIEMEIYG